VTESRAGRPGEPVWLTSSAFAIARNFPFRFLRWFAWLMWNAVRRSAGVWANSGSLRRRRARPHGRSVRIDVIRFRRIIARRGGPVDLRPIGEERVRS